MIPFLDVERERPKLQSKSLHCLHLHGPGPEQLRLSFQIDNQPALGRSDYERIGNLETLSIQGEGFRSGGGLVDTPSHTTLQFCL
jgi:hypothetical protein